MLNGEPRTVEVIFVVPEGAPRWPAVQERGSEGFAPVTKIVCDLSCAIEGVIKRGPKTMNKDECVIFEGCRLFQLALNGEDEIIYAREDDDSAVWNCEMVIGIAFRWSALKLQIIPTGA